MPKTAARGRKRSATKNQLPTDVRTALDHLARYENKNNAATKTKKRGSRLGGTQPRWASAQPKWATEGAQPRGKAQRNQIGDAAPGTGSMWEQQRRQMIRDRNRRRRLPWLPAAGTVGLGLAVNGATAIYGTAGVPDQITAAVLAGVPILGAVTAAARLERGHQARVRRGTDALGPTHRTWLREIALAGLSSAAVVYWIGVAGLSWWVVLALLAGTLAIASSWWAANPIGPGVEPLKPPQPDPAPAPVADVNPADSPVVEQEKPRDDFALLWHRHNARGKGKALNSRLTNREETEFATSYVAELDRGVQSPATLRASHRELASGLGVTQPKLIIEDDERGEHLARVTIVVKDPVSGIRYYAGPKVTAVETDGIVHNAGRYGDGRGELDVTMWNEAGMVPTALIGATRSGKSSVGNIIVDGAMETELLNLLYIDPKGISSAELTDVARIAILGPDNAARAPELINAILDARRHYGIKHRLSKFNPTREMPGWMVLHDEFSELINRGYRSEALAWTSLVNTVAAMGLWPVAINQAMQESKWGDDQCRQAFCSQLIVMRMKTTSDKLVPGLELSPSSLPNRKGIGVYAYDSASRSNVPVQFDYVPEPKDAQNHPDAPLTTAAAFKASAAKQPTMTRQDFDAIVSVLGPPVNGRWVVGPGGTHQFRAKAGKDGKVAAAATTGGEVLPATSGWGAQMAQAAKTIPDDATFVNLDPTVQGVLDVIVGGTTVTRDIEAGMDKVSRATVHRALDTLVGANLIHRARKGEYAIGPKKEA